jgi:glycine oxidase
MTIAVRMAESRSLGMCEVYGRRAAGTDRGYNSHMGTHPDVLVIGGGVIGLTTAYLLARDGASVRLLDRSTPGSEASWAGAGIIPPGNPARAATPYDRLRAESSRAYLDVSAELLDRTGIDNGYRVCGGIEIFERPAPGVTALWRAEAIDFVPIGSAELGQLEPNVAMRAAEVYHLPGMAQVRNPWHVRALLAASQELGVTVEANAPVVRLRTAGSRVVNAVSESGSEWTAAHYLVAAGAWSDRLLDQLGLQTGVHPVRGQMVLFHAPTALVRRVLCVEKRYVVPRSDGRILVGSTEEPEAGYEKRTTESAIAGLRRFATDVVPALRAVPVEKTWSGLRPGSSDGMPFLGRVPGWDNAFVAAGHYRAGIQLSPVTGRVMADLILGRPPTLPIEAFRPDRPRGLPGPTAFRS